MSDFPHVGDIGSNASVPLHETTQVDEAAFFVARGFSPAVLPPEQPEGWARFRFAINPAFETALDEWANTRTALVDVHEFIGARKQLFHLAKLYQRGAR